MIAVCLVSVQVVHPYSSIDTTAAWKKLCFILSVRFDFHMIEKTVKLENWGFFERIIKSVSYGKTPKNILDSDASKDATPLRVPRFCQRIDPKYTDFKLPLHVCLTIHLVWWFSWYFPRVLYKTNVTIFWNYFFTLLSSVGRAKLIKHQ